MVVVIDREGNIRLLERNDLALPPEWQSQRERVSNIELDDNRFWQIKFFHRPDPEPVRFNDRDEAIRYEQMLVEQFLKRGEL